MKPLIDTPPLATPVVHDDELVHYGVKGMKWGVRKKRETTSRTHRYGSTDKEVEEMDSIIRQFRKKNPLDRETLDYLRKNEDDYESWKKEGWLSKEEIDQVEGRTNYENRNRVTDKITAEREPVLQNLKSAKYGSDEWRKFQKEYYAIGHKYADQYASATLKDIGMSNVSKAGQKWFSDWLSYDDYESITDPVTGERDYGLEED